MALHGECCLSRTRKNTHSEQNNHIGVPLPGCHTVFPHLSVSSSPHHPSSLHHFVSTTLISHHSALCPQQHLCQQHAHLCSLFSALVIVELPSTTCDVSVNNTPLSPLPPPSTHVCGTTLHKDRNTATPLPFASTPCILLPSWLTFLSCQTLEQPKMAKTANEASTGRPKRNPNPSAALLNNSEQVTLPSQRQAIKDFRIAEAARHAAQLREAVEAEALATPCSISSRESSPINLSGSVSPTLPSSRNSKRAYVSDEQEESEIETTEREDARTNPKPKGKSKYRLHLLSVDTYL
jgi:hypothetical protein